MMHHHDQTAVSRNLHRHGENTVFHHQEQEDRSSLEAAAEAAAKVNAMLIAKGMLKPNQVHTGSNIITKKSGGSNSLVVAEVEINNLTTPCRNTLTRGTTQEEISKASGAAVTTRGRYMGPDDRARNPRDRCLYLNVQAATKESVDIAVQKINEIIKSMCGNKPEAKLQSMFPNRGGKFRPQMRPNMGNRFPKGMNNPPPPLMSLPTPPPPVPQPQITPQMQPLPQTVTIVQEKLYIGLEHAPPNFDTKNKILGPGGSYLQHIQTETGASVSLRGKGSGFLDLNGTDAFEPMHVHIEHPSLMGLQEAKRLAENLIQTVQQAYVSFQQALAAMPASVPTGLLTGLPQQPPFGEAQMNTQPVLTTINAVTEQPMQAVQPQVQHIGPTMIMPVGSLANALPPIQQAITNPGPGPTVVIPSSMSLSAMPIVSAAPVLPQQNATLELGGQQPVILSQQPAPHAMAPVGIQQLVQAPTPNPPSMPAPVPAPMGTYATVQPTMQLVSQPASMPPPGLVQQPGPPLIAQGPPPPGQPMFAHQPVPSMTVTLSGPTSVVYTMAASSTGHSYYSSPKGGEDRKRRFTEEKDDKIPENLLGYQHGPPHLVNLVRSSPPPMPVPPPISQSLAPPPGAQIIQAPPHGLIMSHIQSDPGQFAHIGGQTIIQAGQQLFPPPPQEGQQIISPGPPPQFAGVPIGHPPPPHVMGPPPVGPPRSLAHSPGAENRALTGPPSPSTLMPPPPPPSTLSSEEDARAMPPPKSPSEAPWEASSKRRGSSPSHSEPEKKKIRGILKNKPHQDQTDNNREEESGETEQEGNEDSEDKRHPASPQYQGQPLRYPNMPSDPNLPPPPPQDAGLLPHPGPTIQALPPGHHLIQQSDPNLVPQVHLPHPHVQLEPMRPEGPPPTQILIEHPGPPGTPIHVTHHRAPAPGQIHIEHSLSGVPPRQVLIEHPTQPAVHIEHSVAPLPAPPGHPDLHPHPMPAHPGYPPPEMFEYEVGTQQVPPPPPQFQNFDHVPVSQPNQQVEQLLQPPPGSAVMVSNTQHFPQYSVAVSSSAPPPPPASFGLQTSGPFPIQTQPLSQPLQRAPEPQIMISAPPPPPTSFSVGVNPNTSSPFQPHFNLQPAHPQTIQGQVIQQPQQQPPPPPPPPVPMVSQPQYQPHPQGLSYWVSQA